MKTNDLVAPKIDGVYIKRGRQSDQGMNLVKHDRRIIENISMDKDGQYSFLEVLGANFTAESIMTTKNLTVGEKNILRHADAALCDIKIETKEIDGKIVPINDITTVIVDAEMLCRRKHRPTGDKIKDANNIKNFYRDLRKRIKNIRDESRKIIYSNDGSMADIDIFTGITFDNKSKLLKIEYRTSYAMIAQKTAKPFYDQPLLDGLRDNAHTEYNILLHITHMASIVNNLERWDGFIIVGLDTLLDKCVNLPNEFDAKHEKIQIATPFVSAIKSLCKQGAYTYTILDDDGNVISATEFETASVKNIRTYRGKFKLAGVVGDRIAYDMADRDEKKEEKRFKIMEENVKITKKKYAEKTKTRQPHTPKITTNAPARPRYDETMAT